MISRVTVFYTMLLTTFIPIISGCNDNIGHADPIVLSLQEVARVPHRRANVFKLTITNTSKAPIVLDLRLLDNPNAYCKVITKGVILLPSYGIPPTPRTTKIGDLYTLMPGKDITRIYEIGEGYVYDNLYEGRGAAFCWIRGGYSPYAAPDLSYPSEWTGCVYSNLVVFDAAK